MSKRAFCDTDNNIHKKKRLAQDEIAEIVKLEQNYQRLLNEMNSIAIKINYCLQEIKNKISEPYDIEYTPDYKHNSSQMEQKWMPYII